MRRFALPLVAGALLAGPALATPAQEHELRSLGQCALAGNLYESLAKPGGPVKFTDVDKAWNGKMIKAKPVLTKRAETLVELVGPEAAGAIRAKLMGEFKAQLEPEGKPKLAPRDALDRYAPIMESCVARADLLSGKTE